MPHIHTRVIQIKTAIEFLRNSALNTRRNRAKVTGRKLYNYVSQILKINFPKMLIVDA